MKNQVLTTLLCLLTLQLGIAQINNSELPTSINSSGAAPDGSAILDVQSTVKGMLIPRMSSGQRTGIGGAAIGLLVYDITTESFWFKDAGGWVELVADRPGNLDDQDWVASGGGTPTLNGEIYHSGGIATGSLTSPDSHGINAQNYYVPGGKSAVRGVNQFSTNLYAEGNLGILNAPALGVPVFAWNVGVLGIKTATGGSSNGAGVYGWNADGFNAMNYGGLFASDGSGVGTNHGIYSLADNGSQNYAGWFKGRVYVEGHNGSGGAADSLTDLVTAQVTHTSFTDTRAVQGTSVPQPGYGFGVYGEGGWRGVFGHANSTYYTGSSIGVYGFADATDTTGTGTGTRYGVYGRGWAGNTNYGVFGTANYSGSATNYGVYGSASGATGNNYGGYFVGDVYTTGEYQGSRGSFSLNNTTSPTSATLIGSNNPNYSSLLIAPSGTVNDSAALWLGEDNDGSFSMGWLYDGQNNLLKCFTDGTLVTSDYDHIVIQRDGGEIAINTTTFATGYQLSVNGNIVCEEVLVQDFASWPDYVFNEDYDLMSLDHLKAYLTDNHHLPNFKPAAEIEEEGIMVAEISTKLTEKVEELTLYILQLHERMKKQDEKINELRQQVLKNK